MLGQLQKFSPETVKALTPGFLLVVMIAMASRFVSTQYGGPVMLYALLFGIAFNFLAEEKNCEQGISFSSKTVLRLGIALLGVRITFADVTSFGPSTVLLVIIGVGGTLLVGWGIARALGLSNDHAVLSSGAVAICGASAALAISAVLPNHDKSERNTILTVVGVTTLSTLAMIVYPLVVQALNLNEVEAGIFLGATIHDVAQVVGAGYMISDEAGEAATIVKLMRVACLVPVVLVLSFMFKNQHVSQRAGLKAGLPGFLIAFMLIVMINSAGIIPDIITVAMSGLSSWCVLIAVAALGVRTSLQDLMKVGPLPLAAMLGQTLFLAIFVAIWLWVGHLMSMAS